MRSSSRVLGLIGASLLVTGCLTLDQCIKTRDSAVGELLKGATGTAVSSGEFDVRLALCGFALDRMHTFKVDGSPKTTFTGGKNGGTGETTVTFTSTWKDAEEGFKCEGRFAFNYTYHPATNHPSYYQIDGIHRVGDPAPIVAKIEAQATKLDVDAPAIAFIDGWKLPDGRIGSAYRVDIVDTGPYTVKYDKKFPTFEYPVVTVIQNRNAVTEGDNSGALGFWKLKAGEALFLISHSAKEKVEVRVTKEVRAAPGAPTPSASTSSTPASSAGKP